MKLLVACDCGACFTVRATERTMDPDDDRQDWEPDCCPECGDLLDIGNLEGGQDD
jgi:transposase